MEDARAFDQNKAYVLAAEPHSVFPIGCLSLLSFTGLMPLSKTKALASTAMFHTPILRQISTWMGLVPATKKNFIRYLETGYSCIIIPGGVQEILYMNHNYEVAYLKRRYGFVQVAIETGSPLVPVFCFGQSNVYKWWKPQGKFYVHVARAIRFAPLIFWGVLGSPVPYRKPIHIIVGRPIEIKQNLNPSREEVAEVHARFISAMEKLFVRLQHRGTVKNAVLCLYQNFLSQS
ncbi:diacylglycerol O-acyltransferase 2D isoform X1 [Elaeis guineensis]